MQTIEQSSSAMDMLHLGDGPFIFSGKPPICRGNIVIGSTSHETLRVRAISTEHREDKKLASLGFGQIRVQTRLAPGARGAVPAHFQIDPHTAPGIYKTSIPWGKERKQVVVHVQENPALYISPSRVQLRGAGGDRLSHTLVIHNPGNVTHTLDEVSTVWLEERDWVGRTLVYTLRKSPDDERLQAFLERLLDELRKSMLPPVRVALKYDSPEIHPGDTRVVEMELTLPSERMNKGRTYLGFIKLMGNRLWLEVACIGSPNSTKRRPL
jgi:hypothetical protein